MRYVAVEWASVPRIEAALLGAFTSLQSAYACGQTEERATAWKALLLENGTFWLTTVTNPINELRNVYARNSITIFGSFEIVQKMYRTLTNVCAKPLLQ